MKTTQPMNEIEFQARINRAMQNLNKVDQLLDGIDKRAEQAGLVKTAKAA
ncbi:hypothetical protein ACVGAB_003271 [Vibrio parahaemolyticus]|nr:hypothetical protein [Vibrio parahaemolyticus]